MLHDGCPCDVCLGFVRRPLLRLWHRLLDRRPRPRTLPDVRRPRVIRAGDLVNQLRLHLLVDDEARRALQMAKARFTRP